MSEAEQKLKKALSENDAMNPEQARQLAAETAAAFDRRRKWTERGGFILACLFMLVFLGALNAFIVATSTKVMLGAAMLVLLAYGIGFFLRVQSQLVVTMLTVLRETKLLRLEKLGGPLADATSPEERARSFRQPWRALSRRETVAWIVGLALICGAAAYAFARIGLTYTYAFAPPRLESYVKLASDGSGTEVMNVSYQYSGWTPCSSFRVTTTDLEAQIRWVDEQGRAMPATVTTADGQRRYTVHLLEPVMPNVGQQVRYTQITESPHFAGEKDGLWTYRFTRAFGHSSEEEAWPTVDLVEGPYLRDIREPKAKISMTVQFPHGVEIVLYDPDQGWRAIWDGTPARGFSAELARNEPLTGTIQYRLPAKP